VKCPDYYLHYVIIKALSKYEYFNLKCVISIMDNRKARINLE